MSKTQVNQKLRYSKSELDNAGHHVTEFQAGGRIEDLRQAESAACRVFNRLRRLRKQIEMPATEGDAP